MTSTQMIYAVCGLCLVDGFLLGMFAAAWYLNRLDRELNGETE